MKRLTTPLVAITLLTGCGTGATGMFLHAVDGWAADRDGRLIYQAAVDDVVVPPGLEDPDRLSWAALMDRVDHVRAIQCEGASLAVADGARDPSGLLSSETFTLELVLPGDDVIGEVAGTLDPGPPDDTEASPSVRFPPIDDDLAALDDRVERGELDIRLIAPAELDPDDLPKLQLVVGFFVEGRVIRDGDG